MKTLILILMLTLGYGQYLEGPTIKFSDLDDGPWQISMLDEHIVSEWDTSEVISLWSDNSDANIMTFYQNFTVINLLTLYGEYETECYNDSTLVKWNSGSSSVREPSLDSLGRKILDMTSSYSMTLNLIYHEEWQHKKPTFQGFMEFLKRKETQ